MMIGLMFPSSSLGRLSRPGYVSRSLWGSRQLALTLSALPGPEQTGPGRRPCLGSTNDPRSGGFFWLVYNGTAYENRWFHDGFWWFIMEHPVKMDYYMMVYNGTPYENKWLWWIIMVYNGTLYENRLWFIDVYSTPHFRKAPYDMMKYHDHWGFSSPMVNPHK